MHQSVRSLTKRCHLTCVSLSVCVLLIIGRVASAEPSVDAFSTRPPDEDLYVYKHVPDISVQRVGDSETRLSRLWQEKALLLTMVFTQCMGSCSPFLRSLKTATSEAGGLGVDYRILVLSFDPKDSLTDLEGMSDDLGVRTNAAWVFGTAAPSDVRQLAEATGYWFRWDPRLQQYDHPSVIVAIDRGRVVRLLAGATVHGTQFSEVVQELRGKFVPAYALPGKVAFRCFEYDPRSGRYALDWGLLLIILPGAFAMAATASIFYVAPTRGWARTVAVIAPRRSSDPEASVVEAAGARRRAGETVTRGGYNDPYCSGGAPTRLQPPLNAPNLPGRGTE
jgi:protein SCO1